MSGARPAASAARTTRARRAASSAAAGRRAMPKAMFSATVAENRKASCGA